MKKIIFFVFGPIVLGFLIYLKPMVTLWDFKIDDYIPDLLWAFSFFSLLSLLNLPVHNSTPRLILCFLVSLIFEIGQIGPIPGTFDFLDIISYSAGILLSYYMLEKLCP